MNEYVQYRVTGMDFPSCAAKNEKVVLSAGARDPKVSTASQIIRLQVPGNDSRLASVERAVTEAVYHHNRIVEVSAGDRVSVVQGRLSE